jgi:putative hemolysin
MDILIVLGLILLNGLFAMSEMALVSSKKARLQQLADNGSLGALKAIGIQDNSTYFISTVQVGITVISILNGIVGEQTLVEPFSKILINLGLEDGLASKTSHISIIVFLTFISVVFGEIIPKKLGLLIPEQVSRFMAIPMDFITKLFFPIIWILTKISETLINLFGLNNIQQMPVSNEEVKELMEVGSEAGVFHQSEQQIVANVLHMDEKKAVSIMTPRGELFYVDLKDSFKENIEKIIDGNYSKVLVVESTVDNVVGVLNILELLPLIYKNKEFDFKSILKKPLYVPETVTTTQVLEQFKANKIDCAILVNEYGENIGLVTLSDIMEAIVGEVVENNNEEDEIIEREDGSLLVDGLIPLDKLGQYLKNDEIQANDVVHTLAGLIFENCGIIPQTGFKLEIKYKEMILNLEIVDMDKNCIDKVLIKKIEERIVENETN